MDLREVFAANLRRLRNAKGVSQDELAYEPSNLQPMCFDCNKRKAIAEEGGFGR